MHETSDHFYPPFQCFLPLVQAFLHKKINYTSWLELHSPLLLSGKQKQDNCFCHSMSLAPLRKIEMRPKVALQSLFYSALPLLLTSSVPAWTALQLCKTGPKLFWLLVSHPLISGTAAVQQSVSSYEHSFDLQHLTLRTWGRWSGSMV